MGKVLCIYMLFSLALYATAHLVPAEEKADNPIACIEGDWYLSESTSPTALAMVCPVVHYEIRNHTLIQTQQLANNIKTDIYDQIENTNRYKLASKSASVILQYNTDASCNTIFITREYAVLKDGVPHTDRVYYCLMTKTRAYNKEETNALKEIYAPKVDLSTVQQYGCPA